MERRVSPIALLLAACLLPTATASWLALVSAEAGRFAPALAVAGASLVLLAVLGYAVRAASRGQVAFDAWDGLTLGLACALIWAGMPIARPWPVYLDASWYLNTAARIDADGGLRFESAAMADLDTPELRRMVTSTFADQRAAGLPFPSDSTRGFFAQAFAARPERPDGGLGPYHPPFFASGLALAARGFGPDRAALAALPWALAWLLSIAVVARLAFGGPAAPLALLLAGIGPLFGYYAGQPYAELAAGALLLAGLAALMQLERVGSASPGLAGAAGLALGLAGLCKLDTLPAVALAAAWWLVVRRRPGGRLEGRALAIGLTLPALQGLVLALGPSQLYYRLNGGGVWRRLIDRLPTLAPILLTAAVLIGIAVALHRSRPIARRPALPAPRRLLGSLAVLAFALASLAAWRVPAVSPPPMLSLLAWSLTPLGVWAAVVGLVLVLEQPRPGRGPLGTLALTALPLVLAAPLVTRVLSPLYSARRFLPLALPLAAVLAAGAFLALARGLPPEGLLPGIRPGLRRGLTWSILALLLFAGNQAALPFRAGGGRDFAGGAALARQLGRAGQAQDVLLFSSTLDGMDAGRLAAPTWSLTGRPVAVLGSPRPDPEGLAALVAAWGAAGREVILVTDARQDPPIVEGFDLVEIDRAGVVSQAPAPDPSMPPRMAPLGIELVMHALEPASEP
ncbi:MAG: hypothetical protein H6648_06350 [Caldilineae bacterium]|nr:hypothetical protein [Caldilineae bacterium]